MARMPTSLSVLALSISLACAAQAQSLSSAQSDALARLNATAGSGASVSFNRATGTAQFVRLPASATSSAKSAQLSRGAALISDTARLQSAQRFLGDNAALFGIKNVSTELSAGRAVTDALGRSQITLQQVYQGVPVFGGELRSHFDSSGNLAAISGAFVPDIDVSTTPSRSAADASAAAIAWVKAEQQRDLRLRSSTPSLVIYREGLIKGVPGASHLAWMTVVGNGVDVRDFILVDAHSGKVIDRLPGIHNEKNRRAFDAQNVTQPGPNYPNNPFWVEGNAFPTGNTEADNMIQSSSEIYDLFKKAFGRDSYDGKGARMDSIFNRGNGCPNASWNGTYISFCPGTTTDDVTAHEWGHAYTEYTHGLVYLWQAGALNEAYSDIWGETVDRINGRGGDTPDATRTPGSCTVSTPLLPNITITAPSAIAGDKLAGTAAFGPSAFALNGNVVEVNDGDGTANDGCTTPFVNAAAVAGKIAFMDRGVCSFTIKAKNAQLNGAVGVIIGNNQGGSTILNMSGTDATITIPSLSVTQNDGTAIKTQLAQGRTVSASLTRGGYGTDNSVRWLVGEDSSAFGGAIRDMWNPTCYGNAGKVSDARYTCSTGDAAGDYGGVHSNSGVPNHGYALLVDGGSYNGQTITAIGLTKAAHIYYRAQTVYQHSVSDFSSHADALEQSCRDLTGAALNDLSTGQVSGQVISASDCAQVSKAVAAIELRTPPSQCGYPTLLAQTPPALCPSGTPSSLLADNFDGGRSRTTRWTVSHSGAASATARDWGAVTGLPGGRAGYAMFAADPNSACSGPDQSSAMRLDSQEITIPAGTSTLRMAFDHWVGTESGYDGGNVKISVNGGAWQVVKAADFVYNPYNTTLITTAGGNTNPIAGQAAFSGSDSGGFGGTWGRSIINLAPYAVAGDRIKLRFEMGADSCSGAYGWYVDDVNVYRCTP